jgi:hypothetical protein
MIARRVTAVHGAGRSAGRAVRSLLLGAAVFAQADALKLAARRAQLRGIGRPAAP